MAPCPFWVPAQPRPRPLLPTSRLSAGGEIASPQAGARRAGDRQPHLVPLDPNALRSRPLHTPSTPNPPPQWATDPGSRGGHLPHRAAEFSRWESECESRRSPLWGRARAGLNLGVIDVGLVCFSFFPSQNEKDG